MKKLRQEFADTMLEIGPHDEDLVVMVSDISHGILQPFDSECLQESIIKTRHLISLEELSVHDGLFNQCLKSIIGIPGVKFSQMAINDFIRGYGSYEELCKTAGLSHGDVVKNAIKLLN